MKMNGKKQSELWVGRLAITIKIIKKWEDTPCNQKMKKIGVCETTMLEDHKPQGGSHALHNRDIPQRQLHSGEGSANNTICNRAMS